MSSATLSVPGDLSASSATPPLHPAADARFYRGHDAATSPVACSVIIGAASYPPIWASSQLSTAAGEPGIDMTSRHRLDSLSNPSILKTDICTVSSCNPVDSGFSVRWRQPRATPARLGAPNHGRADRVGFTSHHDRHVRAWPSSRGPSKRALPPLCSRQSPSCALLPVREPHCLSQHTTRTDQRVDNGVESRQWEDEFLASEDVGSPPKALDPWCQLTRGQPLDPLAVAVSGGDASAGSRLAGGGLPCSNLPPPQKAYCRGHQVGWPLPALSVAEG